MERAVAGIAAISFPVTFVFGMSAAAHLPGPVPLELKRLFATALLTTVAAGLFFLGPDRLSRTAKRLLFLFITGSYITWMVLAQ